MSTVGTLPTGSRGVDCNAPISRADAALFAGKGFTFAIRYVRRSQANTYDLTTGEVLGILAGGLGLMAVQHVAAPGWEPSAQLGTQYGSTAAAECQRLGIPAGVTVWCDLEGVGDDADHRAVVGYCNAWYDAVAALAYVPGLYVGDSCILTPLELYRSLKFAAFWSAYNLNGDAAPAVRGVQMRQHAAKAVDMVPGFTNQNMDVDVICGDALGGSPTLLLP
jgi:hypothetical protein